MQEKTGLNEIHGQDDALAELSDFIKNYSMQRKKAALLYGPSGVGKTLSVYALALKCGYEIIELNASDFRNKEVIGNVIGSAINQQSLFSKGKIILIDEVDMISGNKDRGCLSELMRLITSTTFPVILITNDLWDSKLNGIRSKTEMIEFDSLHYENIVKILLNTCKKENILVNDALVKNIAINAKGDARAAINDLRALIGINGKLKIIDKDNIDAIGKREKEVSIYDALRTIFKEEAQSNILDNVSIDLDECFLWLDENLPLEYSNEDLANAYNILSRADIFKKRIMRWQHWRFLVYISALLGAGVSYSKSKVNPKNISYKKPLRILKIWMAKQKNMKKKAIAEKLAKATHTSLKKTIKEMPYIEIACRNNNTLNNLSNELKLNEEEIAYLRGR